MKKIILTTLFLCCLNLITAQDKIYVHTATAANIITNSTYIDHPDLNNHPNAPIVFCHVWNPNLMTPVYNDKVDGLWYDPSAHKWAIYNEDLSDIVIGAHFFVYIASDPNDVITHVATPATISGSLNQVTTIDDPDFNNADSGPYAVFSHYWNPHGIYNTNLDGFYYDNSIHRRQIYNEDNVTPIPTNAAYKILKNGSGVVARFTHVSNAANITGNFTLIDNPNLNNNPNATFVFSHYYGISGHDAYVTHKISAFYSGSLHKWALYTEDHSAFPSDAAIDIIVANPDPLAINDIANLENIKLYPNPVANIAKITADQPIAHISVFNSLGQNIQKLDFDTAQKQIELPVVRFPKGIYTVNVTTQTGAKQVMKLIKK